MARPTLDTRRSLYGEPRLSDAQVRVLRQLATCPEQIDPTPTARSLFKMLAISREPTGNELDFVCRLTERGRAILTAIDKSNQPGA